MATATMTESPKPSRMPILESHQKRPEIANVVITGIHIPLWDAIRACFTWGAALFISAAMLAMVVSFLYVMLFAMF